MANITDYIRWRGDLSLKDSPFNVIDNLILSHFCYYPFEMIDKKNWNSKGGISVGTAAEKLLEADLDRYTTTIPADDKELINTVITAPRFNTMMMKNYVNDIDIRTEVQFSAVTFELCDGTIFVAFRGTDDNLIGWKEDLNMTFQCPIPSQEKSVDYLNKVKSKVKKIRVGGHSKGGNLAVYASAFCNPAIKRRILAVYNNDGPGFSEEITNSDGYLEILPLTHSIIPQSSLVGKMLAHKEDFKIVFSTGVGGMLQHDPFTWQLLGTSFIPAKEQSVSSRLVEKTLQDWLLHVERADRQKIVDGFFNVFQKTGMETLEDLQKPSNSLAILRAMSEIDPETVKVMREGISVMGEALGKAAKEITVEKASSLKIRASLPESIKSGVNRAKKILENAEEEDEHLMISNPSENFSDNLPDKQQGEV